MQKVLSIDRHRNGISGDPFYVALVKDSTLDNPLVVIVPERAVKSGKHNPESGLLEAFAIDPVLAAEGRVAFADNSWHGDHYFDLVVQEARKLYAEVEA